MQTVEQLTKLLDEKELELKHTKALFDEIIDLYGRNIEMRRDFTDKQITYIKELIETNKALMQSKSKKKQIETNDISSILNELQTIKLLLNSKPKTTDRKDFFFRLDLKSSIIIVLTATIMFLVFFIICRVI